MPTTNPTTDLPFAHVSSPTPLRAKRSGRARDNSSGVAPQRDRVENTASSSRGGAWFNADMLKPKPMCVGWLDIMGSQNAMLHSLKTAANFVAKLHAEIRKCGRGRVRILPMMDGAYIVASNIHSVRTVLHKVFQECANRFSEEPDPNKRVMLRAAIAWGNVVTDDELAKSGTRRNPRQDTTRIKNVMVGMPFVWSHEGEHKAPPFGIFVDVSIRNHTQICSVPIGWVLDKWWDPNGDTGPDSEPARVYKSICAHLDWLAQHPTESGLSSKKISEYRGLLDEYFDGFYPAQSPNSLTSSSTP